VTLTGRRVVLGVSGGIACYKACAVARRLTELGAAVDVVLTSAAQRFVGPVTFEALTRRSVITSLWQPDTALGHVEYGKHADLIILAPATANLIARAAQGIADDVLTALLLAATAPVMLAPAMNDAMFAHPSTQENLRILRERGWTVIGPEAGPLAEGPSEQPGRMSEPEAIVVLAERELRRRDSALDGVPVVVTAGPTREPLDPVRVVTNRSSGRMGYALAQAAYARGATVRLIAGPTNLQPPMGVEVVRVETTAEMQEAVAHALPDARVLVMAAAPADYRPDQPHDAKRARSEGPLDLRLEPTTDILEATADARLANAVTVGFALETGTGILRAKEKLQRKGLNLIVLNMADEPGAGFEVETNHVTLISPTDTEELPPMTKREAAERILDAVAALM
jgi:phosphopantothenoylcysteine decarboxylase/phosphopantothenate--cysteine ligase